MDDEKYTVKASTLLNLRDQINTAITAFGENAEWIGNSDGEIIIWNDTNRMTLCIYP